MRLGAIARSDNSGLGTQTWEFVKHMFPTKTMVVDISKLNGNKTYPERYPTNAVHIKGFPQDSDVEAFLSGLDVVFIAEAAYNPYLYVRARELGVRTAVQQNYEFNDWLVNPDYPKPDMFISPSKWHYEDVQQWCEQNGVQHVYLHCPANRELLPFRRITQARKFLHMAGRSAAHDRNGTKTVIAASRYLKTDAEILIHFQGEQGLPHQATTSINEYADLLERHGNPSKVTIEQIEFENYQDAYGEGDVLLLPRRYGGNCLPLNEALSVGMPVIMPNISPNNEFLPEHWLVPATKVGEFTPRTFIDIYGAEPAKLAGAIDHFYNMTEQQMTTENDLANHLAETISWANMKPQYEAVLEGLCTR